MPFYRFSATSAAADNGYSVLAPNVGTGRWLLLRSATGVSTIADLQSVPPQERSPDLSLFVAATGQWFTFRSGAATAPTDITPASGAGSWELSTAVLEVIPPYRKTFNLSESIGSADRLEYLLVQSSVFPYREAIGIADSLTLPGTYDHSVAIGQTVTDGYSDGIINESIELSQSSDMSVDPSVLLLGSIAIGQTVADGYSDGITAATVSLSQSIDIDQSAFDAVVVTESLVLTGLSLAQSSVFSGIAAATQASMTDGLGTTMTGTNSGTSWIECSFSSRNIRGVRVGGGGAAGFSTIASSLNGATIQTWDGAGWVDARTVAGVTDSGANQFIAFYFPIVATTRIRLLRTGFLATSELVPIETTATAEAATLTGLTFGQSSIFGALSAATQANMTDGVGTTFTGTNNGATEWIECSFSSRSISGVRVGGGNGAGWGSISSFLNGVAIQTWNGSAWVAAAIVAGVAESGANQFVAIRFAIVTTTRIRLFRNSNYISTSELYPITAT